MKLPSKELLSEVLHMKLELGDINRYYLIKDERHLLRLILTDKTDYWNYDINIYELVHKCKEWALRKGYIVDERGVNVFLLTSDGIDVVWKSYGKPFCPYRVFEPCEWIMEQTKCGS